MHRPNNINKFNFTNAPVLNLRVYRRFTKEYLTQAIKKWYVTDFESASFIIQIEFNDPYDVSIWQGGDYLEIEFLYLYTFRTKKNL